MVDLQTDEEKAEAIKKWWRENGVAVISGVVIGLVAIFGWRAWTGHQEQVGQQASLAFEELLVVVGQASLGLPSEVANQADPPSNPLLSIAMEQQALLREEFAATPYVFFGQLALAKALNDQGHLEAAADTLRSAIGQAPNSLFEALAALRLARVLVGVQDSAAASAVIEQYDRGGSFSGDFAALRGDIALAEDRIEDARAAYQQALAGEAAAAGLIRLKLQDLPAPADS